MRNIRRSLLFIVLIIGIAISISIIVIVAIDMLSESTVTEQKVSSIISPKCDYVEWDALETLKEL